MSNLKAGFLTQILKAQLAGDVKSEIRATAKKLGFTMYCHNGIVFSVKSDDELFDLKDLTEYKW